MFASYYLVNVVNVCINNLKKNMSGLTDVNN